MRDVAQEAVLLGLGALEAHAQALELLAEVADLGRPADGDGRRRLDRAQAANQTLQAPDRAQDQPGEEDGQRQRDRHQRGRGPEQEIADALRAGLQRHQLCVDRDFDRLGDLGGQRAHARESLQRRVQGVAAGRHGAHGPIDRCGDAAQRLALLARAGVEAGGGQGFERAHELRLALVVDGGQFSASEDAVLAGIALHLEHLRFQIFALAGQHDPLPHELLAARRQAPHKDRATDDRNQQRQSHQGETGQHQGDHGIEPPGPVQRAAARSARRMISSVVRSVVSTPRIMRLASVER